MQTSKAALYRNLVYAVGFAGAVNLPAQTAPAAPAPDSTIILTPFEVSTDKDRGYFGGSTLAGGRADTPLKITPASISVMTKEFLEDFDLTDMNQAMAWTVGADAPQGGESGAFGGNRFQTSFRGAGGDGNFPVRNGSINYWVADSYNSERYDFSRGPNAALFGDGGPGGLQGSTGKRARLDSTATSVSLRVDTFGGYRTTLDTNYGGERLAVRVNALRQDVKAYQDGTSNKQNGITLAGTWKLSDRTQLRTEIQRDAELNVAYRRTYGEQASRWDRTTVNLDNTLIANPANFGIGQVSATNDYLVYNFGTNSLMNYKGNQYQTVGLGYQIPWEGRSDLPNFSQGVDKKFFLGPADSLINRDFNAQSYWLEHVFSQNFAIELGIVKNDGDPWYENTQSLPGDYRIDINALLPTGAPNPNFGKAYSDFTQSFQYQQDRVREYKIAGTYRFTVPRAFDMTQRFNFNAGWRRTTFEALAEAWRWSNNPASSDVNNANLNSLRYRIYWDDPRPRVGGVTPPQGGDTEWVKVQTGGNINQRTIIYGQLVSQSTFFNERLAITGSFRRDKVEGDFFNRIGNDPVTYKNIGGFADPTTGVNTPGLHRIRTMWKSSPSAGLVAYPFQDMRNKYLAPLGFVANYSSNFSQIGSSNVPLIGGEDPPLTHAKTTDFGIRYAVGDGIAYLTVSKYNTTRVNVLSGWGTRGDFQNLYLNLGYTDEALSGPGTGFNYQDVSGAKLEGWEVELTANPTQNLTFTANYSHPLIYTTLDSRDRRAFYEANRAEYAAGALRAAGDTFNGRVILDPAQIAQRMQNIENSFNGSTAGTLQNNLERHRINVAGSYRFREGALSGLGLTGGVIYRGHKKAGSRDPRIKFQTPGTADPTTEQTVQAAYDYLWVDPTWETVAGANYTRRFGKYTTRFQINITNLLNDDDPRWTSYSTINAGQLQNLPNSATNNGNALTVPGGNPRMQVLSGFTQLEPRKISFTTTISF